MRPDSAIKQDTIIEAALKRFTHFGFAKTTFAEIARDMGTSQQSLYYYFPDKKTLVRAVIETVFKEYVEKVEADFSTKTDLSSRLLSLVDARELFFEKYYMLSVDRPQETFYNTEELLALKNQVRNQQQQLIEKALDAAIHTGEIRPTDVAATAGLLIDTLTDMQLALHCYTPIPDHDQIRAVFEKQKKLITLLITGLRACPSPGKTSLS